MPGRPLFLIKNPNLLEKMHNSVEFGAADHKRRKEIIKVRTAKHLRERLNLRITGILLNHFGAY